MIKSVVAAVLLAVAAVGPIRADGYKPGVLLANLKAQFIDESSGVAASRRTPGIVWTHNDSGDGPFLYAVDRKGETRGVFRLAGAKAIDWEDMSTGPNGTLVVGDIGDNNALRPEIVVYTVAEPPMPPPSSAPGTKDRPIVLNNVVARTLRYADGPHNAEALMVHPATGTLYIVTKEKDGVAKVFSAAPGATTLRRVGTVTIANELSLYPNLITGGDIAPDGKRVILRTYAGGYELFLPKNAKNFDAIWKQTPRPVPLPITIQGESICYTPDGKAILTTSEQLPCPLYENKAK